MNLTGKRKKERLSSLSISRVKDGSANTNLQSAYPPVSMHRLNCRATVSNWEFCGVCMSFLPVHVCSCIHRRLQGENSVCASVLERQRDSESKRERIIDNCSIIIIMPYFIPLAGLGSSKCCRKLGSIKRDIFPPAVVHVETGLSSSTLHLCLTLSHCCLSVCLSFHLIHHTVKHQCM